MRLFSRRILLAALSLPLLGLIVSAGCSGAHYQVIHTITVPHIAARALDVETDNGAITAVASHDPQVTITATIRATTKERAEAAQITTDRDGAGGLVIRVAWPEDRRVSDEGCTFRVEIPDTSGVTLTTSNGAIKCTGLAGTAQFKSSNGSIEAKSFDGSIAARTSNGSISLTEVPGPITAQTSNGSIAIVMRIGSDGPLTLTSSNGKIDLAVSDTFQGRIAASTSNGKISADRLHTASAVNINRGEGTIEFGHSLDKSHITTSNGSISIRQRSAPK